VISVRDARRLAARARDDTRIVEGDRARAVQERSIRGARRKIGRIDLPGLDFVQLAASMGCVGTRIKAAADLPAALASAMNSPRPSLVEVIVDAAIPKLYDEL